MRFSASANIDMAALERVIERFPEMRSRYLGFTANKIKHLVKSQFLSGQEIMLHKDRDSKGRSMVNYAIARRGQRARLTSIPMNLFERGRVLRSGQREPGRFVITRKAPQAAEVHLQAWAEEFERSILQELGE